MAALCCVWMAVPAVASGSAAPRDFYGVVSQQRDLGADDVARMGAGRVGTLRVALPWSEVDPSPLPGDYDWSHFDAVVGEAARQGIVILPTVFTVPDWVAFEDGCAGPAGGPCSITPPSSQLALSAWRTFLGAAARRYGPGGPFLGPAPGARRAADPRLADLERGELARVLPAATRPASLRGDARGRLRGDPRPGPGGADHPRRSVPLPARRARGGHPRDRLPAPELYAQPGSTPRSTGSRSIRTRAGSSASRARSGGWATGVAAAPADRQVADLWITEIGWASRASGRR